MTDAFLSEQLERLNCNRCFHRWTPTHQSLPQTCPNCRSAYWNKPRIYTEDPAHLKTCTRCKHVWWAQNILGPKNCPACKSPYWSKERKKRFTVHQRYLMQHYRQIKVILKLVDELDGDLDRVAECLTPPVKTKTVKKKLFRWGKILSCFKAIPEADSGGLPEQLAGVRSSDFN